MWGERYVECCDEYATGTVSTVALCFGKRGSSVVAKDPVISDPKYYMLMSRRSVYLSLRA
jgi:hypothetical protein